MISCRLLTDQDLAGIGAVVTSRQKYLSGSPIDYVGILALLEHNLVTPATGTRIVGLFEDDELDAFFEWRPIGAVPRADNPRAYDQGAFVASQWSRTKPGGRAKLETGQDINSGHLLNAAIRSMDEAGLFTYWYLTPAAWASTPQRDNPIHADAASKRTALVAGIVNPGSDPTGPYAGFIKRRLLTSTDIAEPLAAHVSTLKDVYRNVR